MPKLPISQVKEFIDDEEVIDEAKLRRKERLEKKKKFKEKLFRREYETD